MPTPCPCRAPPFPATRFERTDLGIDGLDAEVSIDTCRACGTEWLHYLIEEEYRSRAGRWWRVEILDPLDPILSASTARDYIERQPGGFCGGSYFASTGMAIGAPIRID